MRASFRLIVGLLMMSAISMAIEPIDIPAISTNAPAQDNPLLASTRQALISTFDELLKNPSNYLALATRECRVFPEGRIYPYALPALGYANCVLSNPDQTEHGRRQMIKLLDLAIPQVAAQVNAPGGDILRLRDYQKQGTFLSTLNLALGVFQLSTGDTRYSAHHDHVSRLLFTAIEAGAGEPVRSYPAYTWTFDTVMTLASLDVHDRIHATNLSSRLVALHLRWMEEKGSDASTGLPYSQGWKGSHPSPTPPRGCDLSMRICLLAQFAPDATKRMYSRYLAFHWLNRGSMAGFAEWPKGISGTQDIDSGPVIMGIGLTASAVGLGATLAAKDPARQNRLLLQLAAARVLVQLATSGSAKPAEEVQRWFKGLGVEPSPSYVTGFLYGDAALFYAATWVPYPRQPVNPSLPRKQQPIPPPES